MVDREYRLRIQLTRVVRLCCEDFLKKWSGRLDSNQRPPAPKAGALPGCATPRHLVRNFAETVTTQRV